MTGYEHYNKREWLSISSLLSFARCPRKYFYSSGCRMRPAAGEHIALTFGSAIHKALPELLHGDPKDCLTRAMAAFSSVFHPEHDAVGDELRNTRRAKAMLYNFWESHGPGNSLYTLQKPPSSNFQVVDKVSDWEIPFAIDIGLDVPLVGRIDALVRHRDTGKLWGLEWKTSRELSARFLQSFENSPQVMCYTHALRLYTGERVDGVMVEGLRSSKTNAENQLIPISVPDFKIDNFIRWAQYMGGMLLNCEKVQEFPQFYSGCTPYPMFGQVGFDCDFRDLCSVPDWTLNKEFYVVSNDRPFILADPSQGPGVPSTGISLPVVQAEDSRGSGSVTVPYSAGTFGPSIGGKA